MRKPQTHSTERSVDGYSILAANTLLRQVKELENQIDGVRKSKDIEYIHKLRVASRRLRAGLSIFGECFEPKLGRRWRKTIKNLTRSAGAARDADVQIAFLENYSRTTQDGKAADDIDYVITSKKKRRKTMQSDVLKVLKDLVDSEVLDEIIDSCKGIARNSGHRNVIRFYTYEKAYNHISTRLDQMLTFGQFVHDEAAVTKHHELRIAAKRLRYTLEIFSAIYKRGLGDQIALLKKFQDVLGEMHDYDVWIQELSSDIPAEAKYGISILLTDLTEMRRSRYRNFVFLWDDTIANGLFERIRHLTEVSPRSEIVRELLVKDKRVAVISDVHGNLDALQAVVSDAQKSGLQIFLNAGDAVGFCIYPSEVVQTLRSAMFLNVLGNVDQEVLEELQDPGRGTNDADKKLAIKELTPSDVEYLESLPRELRLEVDGTQVLITHGTPQSIDEHIYPDSPTEMLRDIASKATADIIITGHSHMPMKRDIDGVTFLNPGSVGRPVDGDPRAEYAILSFNPTSVDFRRVNYDVEAVANEMRKKRQPERLVQVLLRAVPSSVIKKEEEKLERRGNWEAVITNVRNIAKKYLPDETHPEQDRKLAVMIFNKTKKMHSLGNEERYWLECAALLHDVGLSRSGRAHHKSSLNIILNDPELPFTYQERYIIGSIARYHRKALPDKKHFNLKPLSQAEREKIAVLSSILRVADALDYSHKSIVTGVKARTFPNHISLECSFSGDHELEDMSVNKKKDLFEKVFKCELTIIWKGKSIR
ncbi:MAG TPA: YfcE family phosphodiesterase [Methylomirabilota bacterium]|nr:YfcE family phosphodiesterase [Methylomirabilota bacterium]